MDCTCACLVDIRRHVGFKTKQEVMDASKADLKQALTLLKNGDFDQNDAFLPEADNPRVKIRTSGNCSVLRKRLVWFLFQEALDTSEE